MQRELVLIHLPGGHRQSIRTSCSSGSVEHSCEKKERDGKGGGLVSERLRHEYNTKFIQQ